MNCPEPTPSGPARPETWVVHRQDDNGVQFVVQAGLSREEADRLVARLEALGHKQTYWVERERA